LAQLEQAESAHDVNVPGWRLHPLTGNLAGHGFVWVNGNWRLTFRFRDGDAERLSGRRRQDAKPGPVKMHRVPPDRAWWTAVGAPLGRAEAAVRGGYAICSINSRPQARAYFLSVAREGECFPVASERSKRATEGG
jgi:hypothetical protein